MRVTPGLQAFLGNILDYAGMFPPANLPLESAVRNYAKSQSSPDAWMLSRFVCPAARLAELHDYVSLFNETSPLLVSALSGRADPPLSFLSSTHQALRQIAVFHEAHASRALVEMIELPLPSDRLGTKNVFTAVAEMIETACTGVFRFWGDTRLIPFYEVTSKENWQQVVAATIDAIAAHNAHWAGQRCQPAGFKLRTGGVVAEAFPTPEQIAFVIVTCRDRGVALKCTAGLHHPVRCYDESVQTRMHGFLNVFTAGILAHARSLDVTEVRAILEDEQAAHFRFDGDGFAWDGLRATVQEIVVARQTAILSFGSCSFDAPREDLRGLGWL